MGYLTWYKNHLLLHTCLLKNYRYQPNLISHILNFLTKNDRPSEGYLTIEEFISHPALEELIISGSVKSYLKLNSDYYLLNSKITSNDHTFIMNSSLKLLETGEVKVFKRELIF